VVGDLSELMLGVSEEDRERLRGEIDHFFHLAAIYDMTADPERNEKLNVGGTLGARLWRADSPRALDARRSLVRQPPTVRARGRCRSFSWLVSDRMLSWH